MTTLISSRPTNTSDSPSFSGDPQLALLGTIESDEALQEAERVLLDLADFVYTNTSLKPMSKALFFISRMLVAAPLADENCSADQLAEAYEEARLGLGAAAPEDDFSFLSVASECGSHLPRVLRAVQRVRSLGEGSDILGMAFNTLLRGKWEGGEGLGTFLTPEEVVGPMTQMTVACLPESVLSALNGDGEDYCFGDICGGTGRFVVDLGRRLGTHGVARHRLARRAYLYDQSSLAVGFAKLNLVLEGVMPTHFARVGDSLIAPEVTALRSRFALLATNPPFGTGKYGYNDQLGSMLPVEVLSEAGIRGPGDVADPAFLFAFRNLDLLAPGGVLGIVLPDGVLHSGGFRRALTSYETVRGLSIEVLAIVSLPSAAFALGGTVAKTSFVIFRRVLKADGESPIFVAEAKHVGFKRRGNRRAVDPSGNDLVQIAADFERVAQHSAYGKWYPAWRAFERLAPSEFRRNEVGHSASDDGVLGQFVSICKLYTESTGPKGLTPFHISVLDVDETGLIDIRASLLNRPASKSLACRPGDVLISCLNPKIWRVAVVPELEGWWTCSPEFLVLRPKRADLSWRIALAMFHRSAIEVVRGMAGGTSSSRQRVPKDRVLHVHLPHLNIDERSLAMHVDQRLAFYKARLAEIRVYEALLEGTNTFQITPM